MTGLESVFRQKLTFSPTPQLTKVKVGGFIYFRSFCRRSGSLGSLGSPRTGEDTVRKEAVRQLRMLGEESGHKIYTFYFTYKFCFG